MIKRKQIQVSPTEKELRIIALLAAFWGESEAGIVLIGFRKAMGALISEMEQVERVDNAGSSNRAAEFVKALALKQKPPSVLELQRLANDLGVPSEVLIEIAEDCCCEKEERRKNAVT